MCRRSQIKDKIYANVSIENLGYETPCHIWTGSDSGSGRGGGYGRISIDGGTMAVHRVSYVIENGPIPPRKQIDHLCKNRRCCNPAHLEMVTHKENQKRRDQ